jgi:hypothetical protein
VRLQAVREGVGRALDREALGTIAGGHVLVELATRGQLLVREEGVAALAVADVEVHVVRVGLPVEDEADRALGGDLRACFLDERLDLGAILRPAMDPGSGDEADVFREDSVHAAEAAVGILA